MTLENFNEMVIYLKGTEYLTAKWMDRNDHLQRESFQPTDLVLV
jgi:hypothetical protein